MPPTPVSGVLYPKPVALPAQAGHDGEFLTTSGTASAWQALPVIDDLLPTQTGNDGKVLQTDGSAASWQTASGGSPDSESAVVAAQMFS